MYEVNLKRREMLEISKNERERGEGIKVVVVFCCIALLYFLLSVLLSQNPLHVFPSRNIICPYGRCRLLCPPLIMDACSHDITTSEG